MSDQTELTERYLLACRQNINAPIPPGLDPGMAAFIRQMVQRSALERPDAGARQRVWQKAWRDSQAGQQQIVRPSFDATETTENTVVPLPRVARTSSQLSLVAMVAVMLLVAAVMFTGWRALQFASQPTATLTPTITLTATATLVPTVTLVPTSSPIPVERQPESGTMPTVPPPGFIIETSTPIPTLVP